MGTLWAGYIWECNWLHLDILLATFGFAICYIWVHWAVPGYVYIGLCLGMLFAIFAAFLAAFGNGIGYR